MILETMARDPFHPDRRPGLKIDVVNMVVQSTNAKWEVRSDALMTDRTRQLAFLISFLSMMQVVGDLTQTQIVDKEQGVGLLYKLMKIEHISMASIAGPSEAPVP